MNRRIFIFMEAVGFLLFGVIILYFGEGADVAYALSDSFKDFLFVVAFWTFYVYVAIQSGACFALAVFWNRPGIQTLLVEAD